jgi:hypothetical protein
MLKMKMIKIDFYFIEVLIFINDDEIFHDVIIFFIFFLFNFYFIDFIEVLIIFCNCNFLGGSPHLNISSCSFSLHFTIGNIYFLTTFQLFLWLHCIPSKLFFWLA